MIGIQKVGIERIDIIQSLAHLTWRTAYKDILSPIQMDYMLDLIYSKVSLHQQIEEKGHQFIIASDNGTPAGFASYSLKSEQDPNVYRLHKIYVDASMQAKGVGKKLLQFVLDEIKELGATHLELNVNRHNKAIEFYKKNGFIIVRVDDIDIGSGHYMNDYVMNRKL